MYSIFARLDGGDFLFVASCDELQQAVQLARELNANWPNEFIVQDSNGNIVDRQPQRNGVPD
jgi:GGDEF domain-containing protein